MFHLNDDTLNEYHDDALTPARRAEAESHLAACAECQTRLAGLRALFASIEALPDAPLERDLSRPVLSALRPRPAPLPPIVRWAFVAQAALAVVLTLVAAFTLSLTLPDSFISPAFDSFTQLTESLTAEWQALWDTTQTAIIREFNSALAFLPQSFEWTWLAGLGAVLLLWLAGNGVILRRVILAPHPQRSHP